MKPSKNSMWTLEKISLILIGGSFSSLHIKPLRNPRWTVKKRKPPHEAI
jgi:hypothetical protein